MSSFGVQFGPLHISTFVATSTLSLIDFLNSWP
uniref:Uncharacterized protein n=1 Tax=Anguilla anguilla TaxID=7936 RepID=A0A0E9REY4_ANGAN